MAEIRWILTCDGECPAKSMWFGKCPQGCPNSHYEQEQLNTEVQGDG